ncbi:MAG: PaaI family thioesterase [Polyangiales bacterium]
MIDPPNDDTVPAGFARHARHSAVTDPWEPIWARRTDSAIQLALRVGPNHCNSRGFLHGGVIAALADNAMGLSLGLALTGSSAVTVNLSVDYVGGARLGQWLQIEPRVLRSGGKLGFVDAVITADDALVARCNATFRIVSVNPG